MRRSCTAYASTGVDGATDGGIALSCSPGWRAASSNSAASVGSNMVFTARVDNVRYVEVRRKENESGFGCQVSSE